MDTPEDNKVSSAVSLNLQHGLVPNQCNAFPHPTCITVSSAQEHYPWLLSKLVLSGEGLRELFDSPRPPSCRVTLLEGRDRQRDSCCSVSLDTHEGALSAQQITSLYISPMPRIHSTLCCLHSTHAHGSRSKHADRGGRRAASLVQPVCQHANGPLAPRGAPPELPRTINRQQILPASADYLWLAPFAHSSDRLPNAGTHGYSPTTVY